MANFLGNIAAPGLTAIMRYFKASGGGTLDGDPHLPWKVDALKDGSTFVEAPGTAEHGKDVDVTRSVLPTGAATSELQDTGNTALENILEKLGALAAAAADAVANTLDRTNTLASLMLFNGTTWDRARGDIPNGLDVDVTRLPALAAGANEIGLVGAANVADGVTGLALDSSVESTYTLNAAAIGKMNEVWFVFELRDVTNPDGKLYCEGAPDGVKWLPCIRPDIAVVTCILNGVVSAPGTLPAGVTLSGNVFDVVAATVTGTLILVIPFDSPPPGGVRLRWVPDSGGAAAALDMTSGRRAA